MFADKYFTSLGVSMATRACIVITVKDGPTRTRGIVLHKKFLRRLRFLADMENKKLKLTYDESKS